MQRIGVISDTHIREDADAIRLADTLALLWGTVDLILHAGDITSLKVLEELGKLAKTVAVAGNMDGREVWSVCPRTEVLQAERYRIGITHGDFMHSMAEARFPRRWRASNRFDTAALHAYLRSQFQDVDVIVFGHTHRPHNERQGSLLFFNPGACCPSHDSPGSIGLLVIDAQGIHAEIIPLKQDGSGKSSY